MQTVFIRFDDASDPKGEYDLGLNDFGGPLARLPSGFEVMRRIVETVAITMLIAAVFGTGWLAAGQAFSVVLN